MKKIVCLFTLLFSLSAAATLPHHGLVSSINVGAVFASLLQKRGVIFYRDFQAIPSVSFFFFDDRLEIPGDSISYRDFVYQDKIRLRTRFVRISDDPLLPNYASVRDGMPDRPTTYEWQNAVEFFFPGYNDSYLSEVDLTYGKDISIHHGDYLDLTAKFRLGSFLFPVVRKKAEPNFVFSVGAGDSRHNQYFYGPSAAGTGVNNFSAGFWIAFPEDADRFYPIIQLMAFQVVGDANRDATFASGRNQGVLFSFIATTGLWE